MVGQGRGNALLLAAGPVVGTVTQLCFAGGHPDTEALQRQILREIAEFETAARNAGYPDETLTAAKYVLAAAVDEAVLDTDWGFESIWGSRSLLSVLFRETWGGEKVFAILDRLKAEPARNIDMLELIDLSLSLGFQGKYRTIEGGLYQLEDLRIDLYRLCRSVRPAAERDLAPHLQPAGGGTRLRRFLPSWVAFAAGAAAMAAIFFTLQGNLDDASRPTLRALDFVAETAETQPAVPPTPVFLPLPPPPPAAPEPAPTPAPVRPAGRSQR
jgi:type VI secretion system protein ImpK